MTYIADNGTQVTEEMIDQWAKEADDGFPGTVLTPFEGRAWEFTPEPMKARTIRLSNTMWDLISQDAKTRHISVSEWAREALTEHLANKHTTA